MTGGYKHSLTIRGHRTSVTLEPEFWREFRSIAAATGISANELASRIDERRGETGNLASSIRVFVLNHVMGKGGAEPRPPPAIDRKSGTEHPH